MSTIKFNVNQIKDFEQKVEKIIEEKVKEVVYETLEKFFDDKGIDFEKLKEIIDKKDLKVIQ